MTDRIPLENTQLWEVLPQTLCDQLINPAQAHAIVWSTFAV